MFDEILFVNLFVNFDTDLLLGISGKKRLPIIVETQISKQIRVAEKSFPRTA